MYLFNPGEQTTDKWTYECFPSVPNRNKNPHCYNSFNWFIHEIGGWFVVLILLVFIWLSILSLWFYIRFNAVKKDNKIKYSFTSLELNDKREILEDDEFTTADLPFQICRVYFRGSNSLENQWTIPLEPPKKLKNLIYISAYE